MSYQAITDIIASTPQFQQIQQINTVQISQDENQLTSFSDLVNQIRNDTTASEQKNQSEAVEKQDSKSIDTEPDSKVSEENEVKESKISEQKEEKQVQKNENPKTENKKSEKIASNVEQDVKTAKKSEVKTKDDSDNNDKKLKSKDFDRLNQLVEKSKNQKTEETDDTEVLHAAVNQLNNQQEIKKEIKADDEKVELASVATETQQNLISEITTNTETETSTDFDFSGKNTNSKNQLTLDKEGKITVQDLRTEMTSEKELNTDEKSLKITEIKQTSDNSATITMDFNQAVNADVLSLDNQTAASNGSNFQAMLNNQIQTSAPEFVKAGNLVLKDNNQGTINLVLHPDDLGNVKIHLSLDGKSISGQITVASKEALQVFKDNAETLREAFIKSGFDAASFDVAFNNGGSFNQNMDFGSQNDGSNLLAKHVYNNNGGSLNAEIENILQNTEDISNYSVNIVA